MLRWLDQSGNSNTANVIGTQPPNEVYVRDPAVMNGHDAFRCPGNGSSLQVLDAPSLHFGTDDFVIAIVMKPDMSQPQATWWAKDDQAGQGIRLWQNSGDLRLTVAVNTVALVPSSAFHVVTARGKALRINVDALVATGPATTGDISNPNSSLYLCQGGNIGTQAEIAEVVAAHGQISDADVANLQGYLKAKFKL
jgi:hypothetical protein